MKNVIMLLCVILGSCFTILSQQKQQKATKKTIDILFVGNSLTYYNNLPKIVKRMANRSNEEKVTTEMLAFPNFSISDHWNGGKIQKLINSKKFEYIVIQQGPSSSKEGKRMLLETGEKISNLCKKNNAKLCFFMVWPSKQKQKLFDNVIINYTEAATKNNAILLPVGKVWKKDFELTNDFSYYDKDGVHPSLKGSRKAAKIIVKNLFN